MNNSKLVGILRTFSKNEMKEFGKFIASPYFNCGRNYVPFLEQLQKYHPAFDDDKMTPEYIYAQIYPGKEFNKQVIWNMTSALINMAEQYLLHVSLKKDKFMKVNHIAGELLNRKLISFYGKKLNEMETAVDSIGIDEDYFRYKMLLQNAKMSYHFMDDSQNMLAENVLMKGEYSILNFMRNIADVIGSMKAFQNTYNKTFSFNLPYEFIRNIQMDKIIEYANTNEFRYAHLLEMYYCSVMMILEYDNSEYFFRLRELFEKHYWQFTKLESYTWSVELTNYCVNKINNGEHEFRTIMFELDKFKLKEGMVYEGKFIPKVLFIQIFANALIANETEWCRNFIKEYIPKLKPQYQKPMKDLTEASIHFNIKDYDKVLEILGRSNFRDAMDKLYVRFFYVRIYYELNEIEILFNSIDAAKHFLSSNNSISSFLINNYVRFLTSLNKLMKLKDSYDEYDAIELRKTIDNDRSMAFRDWLLEKLEELKK